MKSSCGRSRAKGLQALCAHATLHRWLFSPTRADLQICISPQVKLAARSAERAVKRTKTRRVGILHGLTYRANSAQRPRPLLPSPDGGLRVLFVCSKTTQRNKQIAMGRKKFNMDPKKVTISCCGPLSLIWVSTTWMS